MHRRYRRAYRILRASYFESLGMGKVYIVTLRTGPFPREEAQNNPPTTYASVENP